MFRKLKQEWAILARSAPGKRFQNRYHRRKNRRGSAIVRVLYLAVGITLFAFGLVLLLAPGPGFLVIFLGGAMIAEESLLVARALDWAELRLRALLAWMQRAWKKASGILKTLVVTAATVGAAAIGWLAYAIVFN
jgi:uncharacterized protein (TIGR02611 family)